MEFKHIPVLLNEVIEGLDIKPDGTYLDCTIGGGGHSSEILKRLTTGRLIGIDRDDEALEVCKAKFNNKVTLIKGNFKNAKQLLLEKNITNLDGVLVDLGVSSYQIDNASRGFSFLHDSKLDMRMDQHEELTAYEVINNYDERKLIEILYNYGEEPFARNIVKNIIKRRQQKNIETTFELVDIIESSLPKKVIYKSGGASKKTFQAIRIEVNSELNGLKKALEDLALMLNPKGRMAVISFHSLEDRIVKTLFKELSTSCICPPKTPVCICNHKQEVKLINKKPIIATSEELKINSRSSSAKLRIIERL